MAARAAVAHLSPRRMQHSSPDPLVSDDSDDHPAARPARRQVGGTERDNGSGNGVAAASQTSTMELRSWLRERVPGLRELWLDAIRARGLGRGTDVDEVMEEFAFEIVGLLPMMLGPHRAQIQPVWDRAAELFGAVAAKRGLAAGEAVEELHELRELVIRDLYRDPPPEGSVPLSLREILRLNRALDRAVTHASVGHTDALFFEFFEGTAGKSLLGEDVAREARDQLDTIRGEVQLILAHADDGPGAFGRDD